MRHSYVILGIANFFIILIALTNGCDEGASVKFVTEKAMIAVMTEANEKLLKEFTGIKRRLHKLELIKRD